MAATNAMNIPTNTRRNVASSDWVTDAACEPNPILKLLSAIVRTKRLGGGSTVATDPPAAPISSHRTSNAAVEAIPMTTGLSERVEVFVTSGQLRIESRAMRLRHCGSHTRYRTGVGL